MNPAQKKIFVVEDDVTTLEMLRLFLTRESFDVSVEKSGLKAHAAIKAFRPDLVLLDAVLPGLDGYSVQKQLFTDPETKNIPIIMISANLQLEQVFVDKENVRDFLHKPFNVNDLRDKINKVLKGKHG